MNAGTGLASGMQVALVLTISDRRSHRGLDNLLHAFGFEVYFIHDSGEISLVPARAPTLVVLDLAAPPRDAVGHLNRLSRASTSLQAVLIGTAVDQTGMGVVEFNQTVAFGWLTRAWHVDNLGDLEDQLRRSTPIAGLHGEALSQALDNHELILHYQLIYDLRKHEPEPVAIEALVRWAHPALGLLMPGQFLSWVGARGLMAQLTDQTLQLAAQQVTTWKQLGLWLPTSVNVSAELLIDLQFPMRLARMLGELAIKPEELTLEVSDCSVLSQRPESVAVLTELIDLGFRLVVDDFGRDRVSLMQIAALPFAGIKIDECLIRQVGRNERITRLVGSIIRLAHDLGMRTCAENIETAEAMFLLKGLGCDEGQGWYFSRPVPAASLPLR